MNLHNYVFHGIFLFFKWYSFYLFIIICKYRPGQDIPSEGVPETQETPEAESSEIRSTATQSSATVENMPRQSSDDEDIPVSR